MPGFVELREWEQEQQSRPGAVRGSGARFGYGDLLCTLGFKAVTHPFLGEDVARRAVFRFKFLPQVVDKHMQILRLMRAAFTPHRGQQRVMSDHLSEVLRQIAEQVEFLWGEPRLAASYRHQPGLQ